jgi:hypothetical protein
MIIPCIGKVYCFSLTKCFQIQDLIFTTLLPTMLYLPGLCPQLLFFLNCFPLLLCWVGVHWHLQRFLQCINYIILEFIFSLSPPSPIHGIVTTGIIIAITNICVHFLHCIHPPTLFSQHLPPPTSATPPHWARPVLPSCSLILQKKKEKKKSVTFLFVWDKGSYTGSYSSDSSRCTWT